MFEYKYTHFWGQAMELGKRNCVTVPIENVSEGDSGIVNTSLRRESNDQWEFDSTTSPLRFHAISTDCIASFLAATPPGFLAMTYVERFNQPSPILHS
jgi:hypothetical protein